MITQSASKVEARVGRDLPGVVCLLAAGMAAFGCLAVPPARAQDPPPREVRIGILLDGPWDRNDEVEGMFREEIRILTEGEFLVTFPAAKHLEGDWSLATTERQFESLLADPEVDILLALGVVASHVAVATGPHPKPVMAPFVVDAAVQDSPLTDEGVSGVDNLAYLAPTLTLPKDLEVFRSVRDFDHLAILVTGELYEAIPGLRSAVERVLAGIGKRFTIVAVQNVSSALDELPPDADAVYVFPLLRLGRDEFAELTQGLIERRLPSFSRFGSSEVEQGILVSRSEVGLRRRARRVALYVQRSLLGERPSQFAVEFVEREQIVINMGTAREIQVYPSFALMTVSELLNPERAEVDQVWSLLPAIQEAVAKNLFLASQIEQTLAGAESIRQARSVFLPQIESGATVQIIDGDRAELTGTPQRALSPFLAAEQLIFSEPAFANLTVQKNLQEGRVWEQRALELDVVQESATAYLDVLRALTFERVARNNLSLSRSNLELAEVRRDLGASGPAEVFRWESEIATDRSELISASAQRNLAQIALNRVLHRSVEESFRTVEIGLDDPFLREIEDRFANLIANQWHFRAFRAFLVEIGNEIAPELRILDASVAAQERTLLSAQRSFFAPTAAAQWDIQRPFLGGASSSGLGALENFGELFPDLSLGTPGKWNWTLGMNASLPLFTGGDRRARRRQEELTLIALRLQRDAVAEQVEQRIRSAMHLVGASYAAIGLTRDAARAAQLNLDLVTDSYSRGAVSILALLDAQNASVSANAASANAVYDFLIDLLEAQRAVGSYSFLDTDEQRAQFEQRVRRYFSEQGIELPDSTR